MKKKLLGMLCACILLSGCQVSPDPTEPTEPTVTEAPTIETKLPLLEQGTAAGNLIQIPSETVAAMEQPEMRLLGNGLLLSEHGDETLTLNHISLEDGSLLASATLPAGAETKIQIGSGKIGLCDRESGMVTILDESFRVLRSYTAEAGDDWYLNQELDTLYIFQFDRGVCAKNLETGEEIWLVDNGYKVQGIGGAGSYLLVQYTDRADWKTYTRCLNLSTATLETLPFEGAVSGGTRTGETWLLQSGEDHVLVRGEEVQAISWPGSEVKLLSQKRHLLAMDPSHRDLTLCDTDGAFVSACSLPQSSHAITGEDFVWSGYWEGYFFVDFLDGTTRLMFWDVGAETEGEDLEFTSLGDAQEPEHVLEPQLYQRAAELSERFGVDIRIAEQCSLDYTHYDSYAMMDPVFNREALDLLEKTLSKYPAGFFHQLCFGSIESIRIEVVGALMLKDGMEDRTDDAGAFAQNKGSYYLIVLSGYTLPEGTIYHEISHVIDKRLEWDAQRRDDALFSEEAWLALQPEGFQFAMSYVDTLECPADYDYFVTDYSTTFPTEDRAELMESVMQDYNWDYELGSGLHAKMQYYADCIRDGFDTQGWPETTAWEQYLK